MDDQQPSTNKKFQDCHQRPQLNKYQPKVIDLLSSESESEMSQKNHESVDKSKFDKVIILVNYLFCFHVYNKLLWSFKLLFCIFLKTVHTLHI